MLNRVRDCTRGASVVELGLVAPIFLALVIGMSDLGSAYSMRLRLEQASQRALERLQQMSNQGDDANHDTIAAEASDAASDAGYPDANVSVTYTNYCDGTAQASYSTGCTGTQVQMKYVSISVSDKYTPLFTNSYFPNHNADGTVTVTGKAGMRVL